eukprot:s656_g9.t1
MTWHGSGQSTGKLCRDQHFAVAPSRWSRNHQIHDCLTRTSNQMHQLVLLSILGFLELARSTFTSDNSLKVLLFWPVDSANRTQENVVRNVAYARRMGGRQCCDVMLAHYKGTSDDWDKGWYLSEVTSSFHKSGYKFKFLQEAYREEWQQKYEFVWALDSDIDFTGVNLVELFDLARSSGSLIVGPTFAGEQAWKTYATDLMAHKALLRSDSREDHEINVLGKPDPPQQYGPEAVQKIMAMLGSESSTSGTWPPGKKVKVTIQEMDTGKEPKVFLWTPESQYFHEVILRQAGIGDFEVFYQDKDGDRVQVEATKRGIEAFLEDQAQEPDPKLLVEWRPLSKAQEAKNWLTGGGGATDQAVKDAQDKVEKQGGKITVSSGSGRSLVDHKGYKKEEWPDVVKGLSSELGLSEDERDALLNAGRRVEGKSQHLRQKTIGNKIVTQFTAYHTVCHGDLIDVVYGKHEESMEVSGGTSLPMVNCIQYGDTLFAVWPPASPRSQKYEVDMSGLTTEIPSGWQIVDSSQQGFDTIQQEVIVPYGWHTCVIVTLGPNGQLEGWKTSHYSRGAADAGEQWLLPQDDTMEDWIEKKDESCFHFKGQGLRLLIQAHPSANHELVNNWQRCMMRHTDFVEMTAPLLSSLVLPLILKDCTDCIHDNAEWGLDRVWCEMASERFSVSACTLLDATPVRHLDWHTAKVTPAFKDAEKKVKAKYGKYWAQVRNLDCMLAHEQRRVTIDGHGNIREK